MSNYIVYLGCIKVLVAADDFNFCTELKKIVFFINNRSVVSFNALQVDSIVDVTNPFTLPEVVFTKKEV